MHAERFRVRRGLATCAVGLVALSAAAILGCSDDSSSELLDSGPPAVLVDTVSYEEGEHAKISRQMAAPDALSVTGIEARAGEAAGLAVLREGAEQFRETLGYRSEWQSDFHAEAGPDYWYGLSVFLPEDWDQGTNRGFFDDRIIFQFHEGTGASPALSLHVREAQGDFMVRRRTSDGFDYLWTMPFETDEWFDFAFHVRWSQDDDGFVQIFADGDLVYEYRGSTLVDGESIYTKWGIYGQPTRILLDEIRIAEGRSGGLDIVTPA